MPVALLIAVSFAGTPVQAQENPNSSPPLDITQEMREMMRETMEEIQKVLLERAQTLHLAEQVARLRKEKEKTKEEWELTKALAELKGNPLQEDTSVYFPVKRILKIHSGRTAMRARVVVDRGDGQDKEMTIRKAQKISYDKETQHGYWEVVEIRRDGVQFVHSDPKEEPRFLSP